MSVGAPAARSPPSGGARPGLQAPANGQVCERRRRFHPEPFLDARPAVDAPVFSEHGVAINLCMHQIPANQTRILFIVVVQIPANQTRILFIVVVRPLSSVLPRPLHRLPCRDPCRFHRQPWTGPAHGPTRPAPGSGPRRRADQCGQPAPRCAVVQGCGEASAASVRRILAQGWGEHSHSGYCGT